MANKHKSENRCRVVRESGSRGLNCEKNKQNTSPKSWAGCPSGVEALLKTTATTRPRPGDGASPLPPTARLYPPWGRPRGIAARLGAGGAPRPRPRPGPGPGTGPASPTDGVSLPLRAAAWRPAKLRARARGDGPSPRPPASSPRPPLQEGTQLGEKTTKSSRPRGVERPPAVAGRSARSRWKGELELSRVVRVPTPWVARRRRHGPRRGCERGFSRLDAARGRRSLTPPRGAERGTVRSGRENFRSRARKLRPVARRRRFWTPRCAVFEAGGRGGRFPEARSCRPARPRVEGVGGPRQPKFGAPSSKTEPAAALRPSSRTRGDGVQSTKERSSREASRREVNWAKKRQSPATPEGWSGHRRSQDGQLGLVGKVSSSSRASSRCRRRASPGVAATVRDAICANFPLSVPSVQRLPRLVRRRHRRATAGSFLSLDGPFGITRAGVAPSLLDGSTAAPNRGQTGFLEKSPRAVAADGRPPASSPSGPVRGRGGGSGLSESPGPAARARSGAATSLRPKGAIWLFSKNAVFERRPRPRADAQARPTDARREGWARAFQRDRPRVAGSPGDGSTGWPKRDFSKKVKSPLFQSPATAGLAKGKLFQKYGGNRSARALPRLGGLRAAFAAGRAPAVQTRPVFEEKKAGRGDLAASPPTSARRRPGAPHRREAGGLGAGFPTRPTPSRWLARGRLHGVAKSAQNGGLGPLFKKCNLQQVYSQIVVFLPM